MPDYGFGGSGGNSNLSYVQSGGGPYSDGVPLPVGRPMANGDRSCLMTHIGFWATGRGANPRGRAYLGPFRTVELVLPAGSRAENRGLQPIENPGFVNGGTTRLTLGFVPIYYGWGGAGSTFDGFGITRPGMLGGSARYQQGPDAPSMVGIYSTPDGKTLQPRFTWNGDYGGGDFRGYRIQVALDPNMTRIVGTWDTPNGEPNLPATPGQTYYARATMRTSLTDAAGQVGGAWSTVMGPHRTADPAFGRYMDGPTPRQLDGRIFVGGVWRPVDGRIGRGGAWAPIG